MRIIRRDHFEFTWYGVVLSICLLLLAANIGESDARSRGGGGRSGGSRGGSRSHSSHHSSHSSHSSSHGGSHHSSSSSHWWWPFGRSSSSSSSKSSSGSHSSGSGATHHSDSGVHHQPISATKVHDVQGNAISIGPSKPHFNPHTDIYPRQQGFVHGVHPHYYPTSHVPAGGTYLPPGTTMPQGAIFVAQPPRNSNGDFETGLLLGSLMNHRHHHHHHTYYRDREHSSSGNDNTSTTERVIIINNGTAAATNDSNMTIPGANIATPLAAMPAMAMPPVTNNELAQPAATATDGAQVPALLPEVSQLPVAQQPLDASANANMSTATSATQELPPTGGIICVPLKFNDTDPNDSTKTIEIEQIACYPAPAVPSTPAPPLSSDNGHSGLSTDWLYRGYDFESNTTTNHRSTNASAGVNRVNELNFKIISVFVLMRVSYGIFL